ncbi:hypothetical protein EVAR_16454_1 [Eumeta japonica]|uniref:Uncharacterized protein n=1 Tax=Eumeta variegata TaxID=151549 RepID=A0A4C1ULX8_EUMVA|nr:hypothetical protein EVAR_16454_1 [Eumeta japonica]
MKIITIESPASPDPPTAQEATSVLKRVFFDGNNVRIVCSKPSAPSRAKLHSLVCLRDKSKWNEVSAECSRQHNQYTRVQNTKRGIKITTATIEDFRKLT